MHGAIWRLWLSIGACCTARIAAYFAHDDDQDEPGRTRKCRSLMTDRLTIFACWICNKTIPLEECDTTDALGYPVHKDCYSKLMLEEKQKCKAATHF
jgi:hypothetical protein